MVLIVKQGASRREIEAIDKKLSGRNKSGFDAKKYKGKTKLKGEALTIQKQLRNEWEGSFS
jgi:hypothetical protein